MENNRIKANTRLIRVDSEFYNWIVEVAETQKKTVPKMSKEISQKMRYPEIYGEPKFSIPMKLGRRGSIFDVLFAAMIFFALALFIIVGYKAFTIINTDIQANDQISANSKGIMSDLIGRYVSLFDGIFLTFVIALPLVIAIGVYFLELHPIFYLPSIFIMIFTIIVAAVFGNTYTEIAASEELIATSSAFQFIPYIMQNFATVLTVLGFLIIIAMYAKQRVSD